MFTRIKILYIFLSLCLLSGCSNNSVNETLYILSQPKGSLACDSEPPDKKAFCYQRAKQRKSYDQYKKERDEIINKKKSPKY